MNPAYVRFLAGKPETQREYRTLEFYNPAFDSVKRFVKDFVDKSFTLESTAPRNAGQSVAFTALAMEITEPTENPEGDAVLTISLGSTNDVIQDNVFATIPAIGSIVFNPIECIYRKYYSGDLTEPVLVLYLQVSNISFEGYNKNQIVAEDLDFANKSSGEIYTLERFPTIRGI